MIKYFSFIFCVFYVLSFKAQNKTYVFEDVIQNNGLSQSSIITIHQDQFDQMWIGTRDGLYKYDGTKLTIYKTIEGDTTTLSNDDILSLQEDSYGYLWVGTYNGLNRFDPKTNTFKQFLHTKDENSLSNNTIWEIKELSDKSLWIGTSNGFSVYHKDKDNFTRYLYDDSKLVNKRVKAILETTTNQVFLGTIKHLYSVEQPFLETKAFSKLNTAPLFIQDVIQYDKETILLATRKKHIIKYNITAQKLQSYLALDVVQNLSQGDKNIRQLIYDTDQVLWMATYNGVTIEDAQKRISYVLNNTSEQEAEGVTKHSVKCIYKDTNGSIWAGLYYGGVKICDKTLSNFTTITKREHGLNYKVVSAIEAYKTKIIYGTEGGGLNIYDTIRQNYKYITKSNSKLKTNTIKALLYSGNDELWIGTYKKGIEHYNLKTKQLDTYSQYKALANVLENKSVYSIQKDAQNTIWFSTMGEGVITYNTETKAIKIINASKERPHALTNNIVRVVFVDSNHTVWVGTEKGLNAITKSGEIKHYFYNHDLLDGQRILTIYEDHLHQLWVGVKSKGIFKYNGTDKFNRINLNKGEIFNPTVNSIIGDAKGELWLSSNQGLIKYNLKAKTIAHYNFRKVKNAFNANAVCRIGTSKLYFGGTQGVTYLNTNTFYVNTYTPKVILTDLDIKDSKNTESDWQLVSKVTMPFTSSIALTYKQSNFSISYAMPNFVDAEDRLYKYRLHGLEKEWNYTRASQVSYAIQNPGDYVFEVFGSRTDGTWSTVKTKLDITVAPAPWLSWWAFLCYGVLTVLIAYGIKKLLKSKAILKRQLSLEQLEVKRNKELTNNKLDFFTNISHEFRTPLALILGPLHQIIEDYKGNSKTYKQLQIVERNANNLLQLINKLMDFRKLESTIDAVQFEEIDIVKFLNDIYLAFDTYAKTANYTFEFLASENQIIAYFDKDKLERLFYNIISNAFKYTPEGGKVMLRVYKENTNVIVQIEDTGIGISKAHRDKIFKRFVEIEKQSISDKNYKKGTGIGLSIAKEIAVLHKGDIEVASEGINKGSVFKVTLPLNNEPVKLEGTENHKNYKEDLSQYIEQLDANPIIVEDELEPVAHKNTFTILVVEDNKELRKFIKDILSYTYHVLEANTGKVAYTIARKNIPNLIISDIVMPEMDGIALCKAVKNDLKTSHIPVMLLASRTASVSKLQGLEVGANDYLSKPFDIKEFKLKVNNLIQTQENLKQNYIREANLTNNNFEQHTSKDEQLYVKAVHIVKMNIGNKAFDISYFATELGVSRTMLFTKIKAWSNLTPNEFINHFKMKYAAQLLEQGQLNIAQISYKIGFKDPKHFSKVFRLKYSIPPSEYAKKFKAD